MTETSTDMPKQIHHGDNIKRWREFKRIKQETLAEALGTEWSQKKISQLEGKELIDDELLQQVADALKVPLEAIRDFSEENEGQVIWNIFHDNATNHQSQNYRPVFNSLDTVIQLYERMLKEKNEEIEMLKKK